MNRKGFLSTLISVVTTVVSVTIAFAVIAIGVMGFLKVKGILYPEPEAAHKTEIDNVIVESMLQEMGEVVTATYTYSGKKEITDSRQFFGKNVPFTEHSLTILYDGVIKAGYTVSDISVQVDNETRIIHIKLSKARITDSYINEDTLEIVEKNNVLNMIRADEVTEGMEEIIKSEEEEAINDGLFTVAEESAEKQITYLLKNLEYQIAF